MIEAKVIADSVSITGDRLTTVQATGPRYILAEVNTHRKLSRNSASSRAIPVEKQLQKVKDMLNGTDPMHPVMWPVEQPGMQGGSELDGWQLERAYELWFTGMAGAVQAVEDYLNEVPEEDRLHKSVVNRILEPYMWHTMLISSTEWDNFFTQRCSPLAQPEFRVMAEAIRDAIDASTPVYKQPYSRHDGVSIWDAHHMPLVDEAEAHELQFDLQHDPRKVSIARCARVSYLTHDGVRDFVEDFNLFERLLHPGLGPPHMSPFEHVATPVHVLNRATTPGNFDGWIQQRHLYFPIPKDDGERRAAMIAIAQEQRDKRKELI